MNHKTTDFCRILSTLENEILDIASSFNIAIGITADELDKDYEDGCYYTNVIVHKNFTATFNQYKKNAEDFPPDVDKDLIPESKCRDLPKAEVLAHLVAIISPWFENYLLKMKQGIDTLLGLGITHQGAFEPLRQLKLLYDRGESVFVSFKQHKNREQFIDDLKVYLSCYCEVDKIAEKFELFLMGMGIEQVEQKGPKTGGKKSEKQEDILNITEPSKEANQAYRIYYSLGCSQEKVAEIMSEKLHRKIKQWHVSRWIKQVKHWRSANGLPINETGKKPTESTVDPDVLDLGQRSDGKITGDPRHQKDPDSPE